MVGHWVLWRALPDLNRIYEDHHVLKNQKNLGFVLPRFAGLSLLEREVRQGPAKGIYRTTIYRVPSILVWKNSLHGGGNVS